MRPITISCFLHLSVIAFLVSQLISDISLSLYEIDVYSDLYCSQKISQIPFSSTTPSILLASLLQCPFTFLTVFQNCLPFPSFSACYI